MRLSLLSFIFLFIFLQVFGISPVHAEGETPTPTPPDTNLFNTSTPAPPVNYACPNGQPQGMFTITPNAYWLDKCQFCITPTLSAFWATNTPAPWETPAPTGTPSAPTATPTRTPYPFTITTDMDTVYNVSYPPTNPKTNYNIFDNILVPNSWSGSSRHGYYDENIALYSSSGTSDYIIYYEITYSVAWPSSGYAEFAVLEIYPYGVKQISFMPDSTINPGQTFNLVNSTNSFYVVNNNNGAISRSGKIAFNLVVRNAQDASADALIKWIAYDSGNDGAGRSQSTTIKFIRGGFVNNPLPTATPTPAGYCNVVESEGTGQINDQNIFSLPTISIGWARCVGLGGFDVPLSWIGGLFPEMWSTMGWPDNLSIPSAQLCFVPLHLGILNLFGLSIDMDIIAFAIGAIALIRIITRST